MSEKKRKRHSEEPLAPNKRSALEKGDVVKVKHVSHRDEWRPIIASAPGIILPNGLGLQAYQKRSAPTLGNRAGGELMLHSSAHPILDYHAIERRDGDSDSRIKHYVGIYDPDTKQVEIMEARSMSVRSTVRSEEEAVRKEKENSAKGLSLRQQLASEFGTKKAKKAIAALTENAIIPMNARTDSPEAVMKMLKRNHAASAVLESMAASAEHVPNLEELQRAIDEAKPRPAPNPDAKSVEEVYTIERLVGEDVLKAIDVKDWVDKVKAKEAIHTPFRYMAKRIPLVAVRDLKKLRALKFMNLLMTFDAACFPAKMGGKRVPEREKLEQKTKMKGFLLDTIKRRFAEKGDMTKWHVDNLMTHIAALSLVIDDYVTDIFELTDDLKLKPVTMAKYFHEIGINPSPPTEVDRARFNIPAAEKAMHKIARLRLPLDFPKQRRMRAPRRN